MRNGIIAGNKMAEKKWLRAKPKQCDKFYKEPSDVDFLVDRRKRKRPCLEGVFQVERIISSRGKRTSKEYLIKWRDYDMANCTWEPEENIPQPVLRALYDDPRVDGERVEPVKVSFLAAVMGKLKSKSLDPNFTIDFDHDIYRCIFKDKGYLSNLPRAVMLGKDDFSRMHLPDSWFYYLDKSGDGSEIDFPIRAKPLLRKSPLHFILNNDRVLVPGARHTFEVVLFYMTRKPCSVETL